MNSAMSVLSWDDCPTEILCQIFSKIKPNTLLNCMKVNSQWSDAAHYLVNKQHGGFDMFLCKTLEDGGLTYRRNCTLNKKFTYFNSLLWYDVSNATMQLNTMLLSNNKQLLSFDEITHTSVYKDKVIVSNSRGIEYLDQRLCKLLQTIPFEYAYDLYQENDFMVVMRKVCNVLKSHIDVPNIILSIYLKRTHSDCHFKDNYMLRITVLAYKLLEDRCYFIKETGHISVAIWDGDTFELHEKHLGRYYGSTKYILAMHVSSDHNICIILRNGNILQFSSENVSPPKLFFHCNLISSIKRPVFATFHQFGIIFQGSYDSDFVVKYYEKENLMVIICPELSCATDHGNVLFLGLNNDTVKIFIKRKLMRGNLVPERTINLLEYIPKLAPFRIRFIDIHEKDFTHELFITINSSIVKFSLHHENLQNLLKPIGEIDHACLSVIRYINIEA